MVLCYHGISINSHISNRAASTSWRIISKKHQNKQSASGISASRRHQHEKHRAKTMVARCSSKHRKIGKIINRYQHQKQQKAVANQASTR